MYLNLTFISDNILYACIPVVLLTTSPWPPKAGALVPGQPSKVLTNTKVLEDGSLKSQGWLNKLIRKYGREHAVFKGNGLRA